MQHIIYADIEFLIKKTDGCANNPQNSSPTKIGDDIPYGKNTVYIAEKTVWKSFVNL